MIRSTKKHTTDSILGLARKTDSCWIWSGSVTRKNGYGQVSYKSTHYGAHRFFYEHFIGKIPKGMQIDHLCKNPLCVNPKHLECVTPKENLLRSSNFISTNIKKEVCNYGHPLSGLNLYTNKSIRGNRRICRICATRRKKKFQKKQKGGSRCQC